jgi:hypothetical protein
MEAELERSLQLGYFISKDPGLGTFLTPGSGIRDGRKSASGSGIRDEQPGSYFLELRNHFFAFGGVKILKFFDEDPGSGMETVRIRDPRSGINIPDPQHCRQHRSFRFAQSAMIS